MKIRFDSDGKSVGGKIYFAVVEEVMIDKDGRPVMPKTTERPEPISLEPVAATSETTAEKVADNKEIVVTVNANDGVASRIDELNQKIEKLIDIMSKERPVVEREKIIEKLVTLPFAPVAEPKQEEPVKEEQPVEENLEENAVDVTALVEEQPEEEVEQPIEEPVEEPQPEEIIEEPVEEVQPEAVVEEPEQIEEPEISVNVIAEEQEQAPIAEDLTLVAATGEVPPKKDYVRSPTFAEKMMASSEILQDRYDDLKNYALRFRKLKSRISKKFDSINQGRFHFVKLSVAGKTLKLYLNMDINTVDPKFRCHDMSDKKTYVTVPVLLRIKSGRAVKYAKRLIDQCAEQHGMLERRKPFVVDSIALIEEALNEKDADVNQVEFDEIENLEDSAMTEATEE